MASYSSDTETSQLLQSTIPPRTPSPPADSRRLYGSTAPPRTPSPPADRRRLYGSTAGPDPGPHALRPPPHRSLSITTTQQPITLSWRGVTAHLQPPAARCWGRGEGAEPPRQILHNVNGVVRPGCLMAILGASGAGKSTLLNVLNQRNTEGLRVEGRICVNGAQVSRAALATLSAYVQQDDIFIGLLRVKEHLWFQSMLRMDPHVSDVLRQLTVDEVIRELGLMNCVNTMIGTAGIKKSLSGGERKRLAFASEVLTNPSLLFCDEPTSGLDSFMAENVVQNLKRLASNGKTIVCTIHQPSSEVYALFDNLLLMADGRMAYMGPAKDATEFFASAGYECPRAYNPADFFIHTLAVKPGSEVECRESIGAICEQYQKSALFEEMMNDVEKLDSRSRNDHQVEVSTSPYRTSWCRQFRALMWRSWTTTMREPMATKVKIAQSITSGLLIGLIFLQQTYDQKGVMNINGVLFLLETQVSFGNIFAVITTFPLEFPVYLRENHNGMYRTDVYYISKLLAEFPSFILVPLMFSAISYWLIGLYPAWEQFLICAAVLVLVTNVATSYGYVVGCSTSSVNLATTLLPSIVIPLMLFGGFFLNAGSVPVYFVWLQYLSWFNFCNEILVVNQWKNVKNITCEYETAANSLGAAGRSSRCFHTGQEVIDSLSFSEDHVMTDVYALLALMVGFRILSYIILLIRSRRRN